MNNQIGLATALLLGSMMPEVLDEKKVLTSKDFEEEFELIQQKKSKLSSNDRKHVVEVYWNLKRKENKEYRERND